MSKWLRVTSQNPCPVCNKPDWCLIFDDSSAAICQRIESVKCVGEAGWLHVLRNEPHRQRPSRISVKPNVNPKNLIQLARHYQARAEMLGRVETLSDDLGLTPGSLRRLGIGWDCMKSCWTLPLSDANGRIIGLNRRFADGGKRIYPGHKAGLYLPMDLPDNMQDITLLVCEGGSDTAAALDLGFWPVGRFSCTHGGSLLRKLIKLRKPARIVIVSDSDGPGQKGSERLASTLIPYVNELKIIEPTGYKDLREWLRDGADHIELHQLIERTEPAKLQLVIGGGRHG
jgi:hypothetical protein